MSEPTTPIPPEAPAVVRRPAASRFVPCGDTPSPEAPLVQRNVLRPGRDKGKALTGRERLIAGDLPEWEPLPLVIKKNFNIIGIKINKIF